MIGVIVVILVLVYERAAYEEEQAAYEDFIASVDLADD